MLAVYAAVPAGVADRLGDVDPDEVVAYVEGVLEAGAPSVDIDTAWDGLHILLTGASATEPIEDDPLSEAVVGVYEFDSDDFLGVTPVDDLDRIVAALDAVDLDALVRGADDADRLRAAFTDVVNIHRLCLTDGLDLLVSIY